MIIFHYFLLSPFAGRLQRTYIFKCGSFVYSCFTWADPFVTAPSRSRNCPLILAFISSTALSDPSASHSSDLRFPVDFNTLYDWAANCGGAVTVILLVSYFYFSIFRGASTMGFAFSSPLF